MKKTLMLGLLGFGMVAIGAFWATDAEAIPVFARKYGMSCNSCHTMFPKLNKMGVAFRERGFRFADLKDDQGMQNGPDKNVDTGDEAPAAVFAGGFPFTIRTQVVFSSAGPNETADGEVAFPGHRMGMLDGAYDFEGGTGKNWKFGFGELGIISSGSYDNFFWWMDANDGGIGMLEAGYYFNDLFKVRVGRVQNNVGYGMTMMSRRPLGFGTIDAAQMAGGTMLMMGDGISIHGTTNGDTGVGTSYNLTYLHYGKNGDLNNDTANGVYARVAQEILDNHIIGAYYYRANNWTTSLMGGEAAMFLKNAATGDSMAPSFDSVTRYGVDFAVNYGEPWQIYGAFTFGDNEATNGEKLDVQAFTVAGEWKFAERYLLGLKWNYWDVELKMMANASVDPDASSDFTVYGIYQVAQNVQLSASYTRSTNYVESVGMSAGQTVANQLDLNTGVVAIDVAF